MIGSLLKDSSGMCVFPTTWGDDGLGWDNSSSLESRRFTEWSMNASYLCWGGEVSNTRDGALERAVKTLEKGQEKVDIV